MNVFPWTGLVFDWDGTLVSCEEKIDLVVERLCSQFPAIAGRYKAMIGKQASSPGWIRKGFIASLPEDYLSYHFGIVAELLAETEALTTDSAWSAIFSTFKASYLEVQSRMLADLNKLQELAQLVSLYVVSNSETGNIESEAERHGIGRGLVTFIGNAKKYNVSVSEPNLIGIPTSRPRYREILTRLQEKYQRVVVVGDNFSLDLATPISMGICVAYIPNPLTPGAILQYIKKNHIIYGSINDVLDILISKKGDFS